MYWSCAPGVGSVEEPAAPAGTTTGSPVTPATVGVNVKSVTGPDPPLGTIQLTVTDASPGVAVTVVGAEGTVPNWAYTVRVPSAGTARSPSPSLRPEYESAWE